jgi:hypothetical protein
VPAGEGAAASVRGTHAELPFGRLLGSGDLSPVEQPGREFVMMKLLCTAALLIGLAVPLPSVAKTGLMTGNQLYEFCSEPAESVGHTFCLAYILGWSEMRVVYEVKQAQAEGRDRVECHSEGGKSGYQKVDVVAAYLRDHPEVRHMSAVLLVLAAFEAAWPC